MKLYLVFTGKTSDVYLKTGIMIYLDRLKHYLPTETREITLPRYPASLDTAQIRNKDYELINKNIASDTFLVLLDESGKQISSAALADFLQMKMNQGIRSITFVVAGAYGASEELRKRADFILSLSGMTFTHQMCRLILAEQLYRAMTILKREPYHNP